MSADLAQEAQRAPALREHINMAVSDLSNELDVLIATITAGGITAADTPMSGPEEAAALAALADISTRLRAIGQNPRDPVPA